MIYLDHNATTPLHPQAREAMLPFLGDAFGNPSSYHRLGREAKAAVDRARKTLAEALGTQPQEIVFTGSGTEADNLALRGVAHALRKKGRHIITSAIEHHAVLQTCRALERDGFAVTCLRVDAQGRVDPDAVVKSIRPDTILISIMYANNETAFFSIRTGCRRSAKFPLPPAYRPRTFFQSPHIRFTAPRGQARFL